MESYDSFQHLAGSLRSTYTRYGSTYKSTHIFRLVFSGPSLSSPRQLLDGPSLYSVGVEQRKPAQLRYAPPTDARPGIPFI